jgi:histidinol-phosphate/aromatic aminotransferase/cobyric acid decarboxylase-like protein
MPATLNCFKAYDIRGKVPEELDKDLAYRIGQAFAAIFKPRSVAVGHDIRLSGPSLTTALAEGLMDAGVDVVHLGLCGTEEIYFAASHLDVDGGIIVTASHNPAEYNGMKLVRKGAVPVSGDTGLKDIEQMALSGENIPTESKGSLSTLDIKADFVTHLLSYVNCDNLKPLKLVVNPGNPTGSYLGREEADGLVDLCRRRRLALIVDEVFWDYVLEEEPEEVVSFAGEKGALTFVLSGLSKVAGLPQMKLSWIGMGGPEPLYAEARERLEHVSDVFLSVGTPIQQALGRYLDLAGKIQPVISSRLEQNLKLARDLTSGSPVDVPKVGGGWNAVFRLPAVRSSEEWALTLLGSDNVYVHPGYLFDFNLKACLVVSLLTPPEVFDDAVRRLLKRTEEG